MINDMVSVVWRSPELCNSVARAWRIVAQGVEMAWRPNVSGGTSKSDDSKQTQKPKEKREQIFFL